MTKYSEIMVIFWLIPVVLQIVLPLIMLVFYGTVKVMRVVFFREGGVQGTVDDEDVNPKLQPGIT